MNCIARSASPAVPGDATQGWDIPATLPGTESCPSGEEEAQLDYTPGLHNAGPPAFGATPRAPIPDLDIFDASSPEEAALFQSFNEVLQDPENDGGVLMALGSFVGGDISSWGCAAAVGAVTRNPIVAIQTARACGVAGTAISYTLSYAVVASVKQGFVDTRDLVVTLGSSLVAGGIAEWLPVVPKLRKLADRIPGFDTQHVADMLHTSFPHAAKVIRGTLATAADLTETTACTLVNRATEIGLVYAHDGKEIALQKFNDMSSWKVTFNSNLAGLFGTRLGLNTGIRQAFGAPSSAFTRGAETPTNIHSSSRNFEPSVPIVTPRERLRTGENDNAAHAAPNAVPHERLRAGENDNNLPAELGLSVQPASPRRERVITR